MVFTLINKDIMYICVAQYYLNRTQIINYVYSIFDKI